MTYKVAFLASVVSQYERKTDAVLRRMRKSSLVSKPLNRRYSMTAHSNNDWLTWHSRALKFKSRKLAAFDWLTSMVHACCYIALYLLITNTVRVVRKSP